MSETMLTYPGPEAEEQYAVPRALGRGETVLFEGVEIRAAADQSLVPGATYIAERNTGPQLLTVHRHVVENNLVNGFVLAVEAAYAYDGRECTVVDLLID